VKLRLTSPVHTQKLGTGTRSSHLYHRLRRTDRRHFSCSGYLCVERGQDNISFVDAKPHAYQNVSTASIRRAVPSSTARRIINQARDHELSLAWGGATGRRGLATRLIGAVHISANENPSPGDTGEEVEAKRVALHRRYATLTVRDGWDHIGEVQAEPSNTGEKRPDARFRRTTTEMMDTHAKVNLFGESSSNATSVLLTPRRRRAPQDKLGVYGSWTTHMWSGRRSTLPSRQGWPGVDGPGCKTGWPRAAGANLFHDQRSLRGRSLGFRTRGSKHPAGAQQDAQAPRGCNWLRKTGGQSQNLGLNSYRT